MDDCEGACCEVAVAALMASCRATKGCITFLVDVGLLCFPCRALEIWATFELAAYLRPALLPCPLPMLPPKAFFLPASAKVPPQWSH